LLNSGALVILEDFVRPCKPGLSDKKATVVSKVIALSLGIVSLLLVVLIKFAGKGIISVSILNICYIYNIYKKFIILIYHQVNFKMKISVKNLLSAHAIQKHITLTFALSTPT
jgi:hypothetical protein